MQYEDEIDRMRSRKGRSRKNTSSNEGNINYEQLKKYKKMKRLKRKRRILITELIVLFFVIIAAFYVFKWKNNTGTYTFAIFGVDSRDGNLDKGALSDVEMICSIDRKTGDIKLISVYRDTYLKIDSKGTYHKINEAYFKGGHKQALDALNENLDLSLKNYATFNWKAVVDAINILGGVDLEITDSEFKYINSFITETVNSTGVGSVQLKKPGMQHLDGVQAVAYARLRLMDTDFNRTARQRKVISLALDKAKNAKFSVLNNIIVAVLPQISTNIGIDDIIALAKNADKYNITETSGFPFSHKEKNIGKKDCVIPTTLESNVIQLHQILFNDNNYSPSSTVKKISSQIGSDSGLTEVTKNAPPAGTGSNNKTSTSEKTKETTSDVQTEPETETQTETETVENTKETIKALKETTQEENLTSEEIGPASQIPSTTAPASSEEVGPGINLN